MDLGWKDRVAVVTGGSSGIGRATVRTLLREGARVAFCARGAGRITETEAALHAEGFAAERILGLGADVVDAGQMDRFHAAVVARFGRVDALINNAGAGRMSNFADTDDAAWEAELKLKFFSVIHPTRRFLPQLEASGSGAVVVVNALLAYQPDSQMVATSAARAGVQNLIKSMSLEFAPKGVRVNGIVLGVIDSAQWQKRFEAQAKPGQSREDYLNAIARQRQIPLGRMGRPEEPAAAIAFLASPAASFITGASLEVSGGASRAM